MALSTTVTSEAPDHAADQHPLAGLERLLERSIAAEDLAVPPHSPVVARVQELMASRGFGMAEVAALVGADAALAADVLRCASSPLYRRASPVLDLTQALTRIGAQQATRLLLAAGLATHVRAPGPLAELRRLAWIEGIASAVVCQTLARLRALPAEDAFTLGLMHDFGRVVALAGLEGLVRAGHGAPEADRAAWEALVDRHHLAVGALTARRWQLPRLVREVMALHHGAPGECADVRLLEVVRAADQVVALMMARPRVGEEELARLKAIAPDERAPVGRALEQVPDQVAWFEAPEAPAAEPRSRLRQPATTFFGARRPLGLGVSVKVANRPRDYDAVAIGTEGIELVGAEHLPVNRLLEAELRAPRPVSVWILTTLCRAEGTRHRIEARPFALTGPGRAAWEALGQPSEG